MTRLTTPFVFAALSLLPFGQPLLLGTLSIATATTAVVLRQGAVIAQDASVVPQQTNADEYLMQASLIFSKGISLSKENHSIFVKIIQLCNSALK